jgi:hypothetical protein
MLSRRNFICASVGGAAALAVVRAHSAFAAPGGATGAAPIKITVYKTPTCGCCKVWVEHLTKNGFAPTIHDLASLDDTKKTLRIAPALQSCHTAVIGSYWFEGHVPADLIAKVVAEKPAIAGLAVPGMPQGSPGMETGHKDPYDVLAVDRLGKTRVYAKR